MNKIKNKYQLVGKLYVSKILYYFVNKELLKKTKIKPELFWTGLEKSLYCLKDKNEKLLETRKDLQKSIDEWHLKNKAKKFNINKYKKFLLDIGYLKKKLQNLKFKLKMLMKK